MIIALFITALLAAILGLAATKPDTFHVERSTMIKAAPEIVFSYLNDFHKWSFWSPWDKLDFAMKTTYSGEKSGQGSVYEWDGNKKAGKGRMEITESTPFSMIAIKLDFFRPFEAHNTVQFSLGARGDSTYIEWSMQGSRPYLLKVINVFVSMDKMIGKDFDTGLADLKSTAERGKQVAKPIAMVR